MRATTETGPYLAPIERPRRVLLRLLSWFLRRQFGKAPGWLTVFSARMPLAYTTWMGKVGRLDKKLELPPDTVALVRQRVNRLNGCTHCTDAAEWYAITKTPHFLPKLDALHDHGTSPLLDERERAALEFATELTERKQVSSETFAALSRLYSERQICELVWVVSSNHLFNINNLGLAIGSDGLCELVGGGEQAARQGA